MDLAWNLGTAYATKAGVDCFATKIWISARTTSPAETAAHVSIPDKEATLAIAQPSTQEQTVRSRYMTVRERRVRTEELVLKHQILRCASALTAFKDPTAKPKYQPVKKTVVWTEEPAPTLTTDSNATVHPDSQDPTAKIAPTTAPWVLAKTADLASMSPPGTDASALLDLPVQPANITSTTAKATLA